MRGAEAELEAAVDLLPTVSAPAPSPAPLAQAQQQWQQQQPQQQQPHQAAQPAQQQQPSMPAPAGVDAVVWAELPEGLRRELSANAATTRTGLEVLQQPEADESAVEARRRRAAFLRQDAAAAPADELWAMATRHEGEGFMVGSPTSATPPGASSVLGATVAAGEKWDHSGVTPQYSGADGPPPSLAQLTCTDSAEPLIVEAEGMRGLAPEEERGLQHGMAAAVDDSLGLGSTARAPVLAQGGTAMLSLDLGGEATATTAAEAVAEAEEALPPPEYGDVIVAPTE